MKGGVELKNKQGAHFARYTPRYFRDESEIPETLNRAAVYDKDNFITLAKKSNRNSIYIDFDYDETASVKRLGRLKRLTGVFSVFLVVLLFAFILGQSYIPQIVKGLQNTEEAEVSPGNRDEESEEAIAYNETTGLAIYSNSFNLKLINPTHPADETYTVDTEEVYGINVDKRIVDALKMLYEAALNDGVELAFDNGYLTYEEQEIIYNAEVLRLEKKGATYLMSRAQAKKTVFYPGEADAQTGLSVAVSSKAKDFTNTKQFKWLNENAAIYGFIFRYPEWKTSYTGNEGVLNIIRYVGTENAVKMRQLSMCLEEYRNYIYSRN